MITKKNIYNAIERDAFEWQLAQKNILAICQDIIERLERIEKAVIHKDPPMVIAKKKKGARTKWTKEEDKLLYFMKDMRKSYDYIAKELGRTPNAVQTRWHKHLKKRKAE